ncbi:MAG: phosphoglycerate kinase [Thermoplasmata archaeon]|mgnify:CR=1 FL=1|nr:MAG: phosphoglycerate kinase [Thermoplasmata archaeon]
MSDLPFLTMDDVEFGDLRVLLRVDINSPVDPTTGKILDDTRMRESLATINELRDAMVIILAHQSRPGKDDFVPLEEHAKLLSSLLQRSVDYVDDLFGSKALDAIKKMEAGDILMLENTRFYAEEIALAGKPPDVQAGTHIVRKLSHACDVYVNDAFAAAHRSQPTLTGFAHVMPSVAGRLMEREVRNLNRFLRSDEKPVIAVLGGAKVEDSIAVAENLLKRGVVDKVLTTGVVAILFLHAAGYDIGAPNREFISREIEKCDMYVEKAKDMIKKYEEKIEMPMDVVMNVNGYRKALTIDKFPATHPIFDIGLDTIAHYSNIIESAGKVILNGPAGVFELPNFSLGTVEIFNAVARCEGFTVAGGGHTVALLRQLGIGNNIDHISTGGGALITYLSGKTMPVIEALAEARKKYTSGGYKSQV